MFFEEVNPSQNRLGQHGTNQRVIPVNFGLSPAARRPDGDSGTVTVGQASGAQVVSLQDMHSTLNAGTLTAQARAAVTVKVSTSPRDFILQDRASVIASGSLPAAPAAVWQDVALGANTVVEIPSTVTGAYVSGAAYVVFRRG